MKKKQGVLVLILTVVLIGLLAFTTAVGFGPTGTGSAKNIKTGLDLSGGVSITYQAKGDDPSQEDMDDTVYKLQKRVEDYSEEAQVYQEGDDRITVEIPGVTDANKILEDLGKPGSLEFQDESGNVVLDGSDIAGADGGVTEDQTTGSKQYVVELTLTKDGTTKFAEATAANLKKRISIVYDGETISSPVVQSVISDGKAQISGQQSIEEAKELASIIRIGSLKLELKELRSNVVGAQLGQQAIKTSLIAGAIGLVLVGIFMIIVYALPGVVAALSLAIYTGLELVMLNAFDLTLTLPGIAGIILSIGMAVDANVIIYARIREEIAAGKSVRSAIKIGFEKAMSAIVDGNITTLIAAAVLGAMGSGSVKGFAMTLALGIVLSMFTALVISRLLVNAFYAVGLRDEKFYGKQKERKTIDFLGKRKLFFTISVILILLVPVGMGVFHAKDGKALNYSLEFKGGTATTVTFDKSYTLEEINSEMVPLIESTTGSAVQIQTVQGSNEVIFKTGSLDVDQRQALNQMFVDNFGVDETLITSETISSTISNEMKSDTILAVAVAIICMLIYIRFRFSDIRFGVSSIACLLHDVLVVITFYALARVSVSNTFIACLLTIVGYSINATIVIFDRVRENMAVMTKKDDLQDVVNHSITQTLSRSLFTSLTTLVMVGALYIWGVTSIRDFALPLMVGIICGAYSSVCIAGALWYVLRKKFAPKAK